MTMFTKTSIALAIIVAICSSAGAATRQPGTTSNDRGTVLINHCASWDAYALRCDSAE
jgi:hypothetical protein